MAFLDNSGDIILDAVLTDTGRQRLSQGNFSIRKYALGDDEIQYNLFDKDHPSGSAYYDLEILQTPVETAHTKASNIQYGLISLTSQNILYIPDLVMNEKTEASILKLNKVVHLAVNQETSDKLTSQSGVDSKYVLRANNQAPARGILIESGINSTDLKGTAINRNTYLQSVNMLDQSYTVAFDSRFFNGAWGPGNQAVFDNNAVGDFTISFGPLNSSTVVTPSEQLINYSQTTIKGTPDLIYYYASANSTDTSRSAISGPRGTVAMINMNIFDELATIATGTRSDLWGKYGQLSQTPIAGATQKYDIIDSFVVVSGVATGRSAQIPVRILRYVSG